MIGTSAKFGDMFIVDASQAHPERYDCRGLGKCPGVVLVWGNDAHQVQRRRLLGPLARRSACRWARKIVVGRPAPHLVGVRVPTYWLPVRPGTDAALAMAMLNVIIGEDLYDHEFVDCWTYGFDALAERVADKTPGMGRRHLRRGSRRRLRGAARLHRHGVQLRHASGASPSSSTIAALGRDRAGGRHHGHLPATSTTRAATRSTADAFLIETRYGLGDEYIDPAMYAKKLIAWPRRASTTSQHSVVRRTPTPSCAAIETGEPYPIQMFWYPKSTNALSCASMDPRRARAHALKKVPTSSWWPTRS